MGFLGLTHGFAEARPLSRFDRENAAGAALPPGVALFHAALSTFFTSVRAPSQAALPGDRLTREPGPRERHAQALAYAARRRRAAFTSRGQGGPDLAYWKAGVPVALARAASIRAEARFARLP